MELREINDDADEIEELLSGSQRDDNEVESYFVEYAIQKEIINRNRLPASRRLLGQAVDNNLNSSPQHQNNKVFWLFVQYPESLMIIFIN